MEQAKARALLGLDDSASLEDVTDALDQAVFNVRDHFLRNAVVPRLAESKVEKCVLLSDAAQSLGVSSLGHPTSMPSMEPSMENLGTDLESLVVSHTENLRRCRSAMATTLDPDSIAQLGHLMSNIQLEYIHAFVQLTDSMDLATWPQAVPARQEADWMGLLAAVRAAKVRPGADVLLQEMVSKERARMSAMVSSSQPTPR